MSVEDDLAALSELCGIVPDFYDLHGTRRITAPATQKAMLAANGIDVSSDDAISASLEALRHSIAHRWFPDEIIVESQTEAVQEFGLGAQWHLCLDGSDAVVARGAPGDVITLPPLPSGIYALTASVSGRTEIITVLVAPARLPTVADVAGRSRMWGVNLSLYALRSNRNSGIGDFEDLARAAQISAAQGADFTGINPLHNMGFCDATAISPYSPSHRGYLNTSYIALDKIPGLKAPSDIDDPDDFAKLRARESVPYADHKPAHSAALHAMFARFKTAGTKAAKDEFAQFKSTHGADLDDFARYEALSEDHGADWRAWPENLKAPSKTRRDFHMWMQWVAAVQLTQAQSRAVASGMALGLYLDLAVGARRDGAEAWCEQSVVARGVSIGAPPDHLSPQGQNWNLTAFSPLKLKAQRYRPIRRIMRQIMRHAGLIRIDHVLGLNRSFWLPDDGSPGAYIHQPFQSLIAVIKIEAEHHGCAVVGEDLGLVPDGFRDEMRAHGFYGYSVLQYEKTADGGFRDPGDIPAQVLSCFATHDTPTVTGYETGRDIDWWQKLDWIDAARAAGLRAQRAREVDAFKGGRDFSDNIHARLAHSKAALVAVQLDDIERDPESQNLPGTIDEHPNWQRRYAVSLENLPQDVTLAATGETMLHAGRGRNLKGTGRDDPRG